MYYSFRGSLLVEEQGWWWWKEAATNPKKSVSKRGIPSIVTGKLRCSWVWGRGLRLVIKFSTPYSVQM